jgi:hypothetical protein
MSEAGKKNELDATKPGTDEMSTDIDTYVKVSRAIPRMIDRVIEIANSPRSSANVRIKAIETIPRLVALTKTSDKGSLDSPLSDKVAQELLTVARELDSPNAQKHFDYRKKLRSGGATLQDW